MEIRNSQFALRNSLGCSGDDGRGVIVQLQPRGMGWNGHWVALSSKSLWQIPMAICFAADFGRGGGSMVFLEHAAHGTLVYPAAGLQQRFGATPGSSLESGL